MLAGAPLTASKVTLWPTLWKIHETESPVLIEIDCGEKASDASAVTWLVLRPAEELLLSELHPATTAAARRMAGGSHFTCDFIGASLAIWMTENCVGGVLDEYV